MADVQTDEIDQEFERVIVTNPDGFGKYVVTGRTFDGDNVTTYARGVQLNGAPTDGNGFKVGDENHPARITKEEGPRYANIQV